MTTRVLLAEDNAALAQMLQTFLAAQGLEALIAGTGTEALRVLSSSKVDLLLLDLKLPELSGVELLQRLRKSPEWATLPVVIMTGVYRGEKYALGAQKLGVRHYLEKPFSRQAFLDAVQSSLADMQRAEEPRDLFGMIRSIHESGKSGTLILPQGVRVVFLQGEPVTFISRGERSFPSFLSSTKKIADEDLKLFVDSGEGRLFFTHTGLLTYDDLVEQSRLFLSSAITASLREAAGFSFKEEPFPQLEFPLIPLSVPRLVYQATREKAIPFQGEQFIGTYGGKYPARTKTFYRLANLLILRREEIDFLQALNPQRPLKETITATESPREAAAFYNFLLSLGMVAFGDRPTPDETPGFVQKNLFNRPIEEIKTSDEPAVGFDDLVEEVSETLELVVGTDGMAAPLSSDDITFEQTVQREFASIQNKNYYEIFGLSQNNFSFNALKEAYFGKTRQYSPERFMELSGTTMNMAQDILSHYANAYNTLSSVVAKERYDEMLNADTTMGIDGKQDDKLQARIQFQSGSVFLEMGEFDNAEKALQDAYTLEPDNAGHCALLALAIYRNPANHSSKAALEKAKMLLAKSLQIEKNAVAYALRGWMLMDEGREGLAEGEFQKALKINPRESNARKGLNMIAEKRESDKKGLFRKIFS
ncbi:response regulator [Geotalea sp. SG265]|uniref:response regulator n=1 Tax=Geotalea sp. SG265 TaxID=2922867 RepID=UPI001FB01F94|nr:response regulator [Geotalea sp. SG265]